MKKKKWDLRSFGLLGLAIVILVALAILVTTSFADTKVSREMSVKEAQRIVDSAFSQLPKKVAFGAVTVFDHSKVTVKSCDYGNNKDVILACEYETIDAASEISKNQKEIIDNAYAIYRREKDAGNMMNATKLRLAIREQVAGYIENAKPLSGEVTLYLYEIEEGKFSLYLSDEAVDTCFGGVVKIGKIADSLQTAEYEHETVDIKNNGTVRTAIKDCFKLSNYDSQKPETGNFIVKAWRGFEYDFQRNFVEDGRWAYLVQGLGTTLSITALAGLMGVALGFLIAIVRCTNQMTGKLVLIDKVCRVYLTVLRGTPVMVQLLIIYFVLLLPIGVPKFLSAVLCFGLNSGAYVAEIVRGGIMSIDKGQNEAGRSLGFSYSQTMVHFIMPQAFKAVLPALANEFITLLKESSVAFYIGVADLTQGGLKIRSLTYSNYMPLIAVALIYLVIVLVLTKLVGILERRLRKSER